MKIGAEINFNSKFILMKHKLKGKGLIRQGAPPKIRALLEKYGDQRITMLQVGRFPIYSVIERLANIISLGKWEENKAKLKYDKMFHLFFIITLEDGFSFKLERNQVVTVKTDTTAQKDEERMSVNPKGATLAKFLGKGEDKAKPQNLWVYDSISNNCQCFVRDCLRGIGAWNSALHSFVMQDAASLIEGFSWFKGIARAVTDAAAVVDHVQEGEGQHGYGKKIVFKTPVLDRVKKKYGIV